VHTSEFPDGNRTTDRQIADLADGGNRVVVTKDRDFRDSHLLMNSPRRLLVVVRTGNITNDALLKLFEAHLDAIVNALDNVDFAELRADSLVAHRRRRDTTR
jgi:predicted nuclease of predicted toxin-antitoxin system